MGLKYHFELLAAYNRHMNSKVYAAASHLGATELGKERGAFFGSILGTLNHLIVGDTIWLKRFAKQPSSSMSLREVADLPDPASLDQIVFTDFKRLSEHRAWLDRQIINWIGELSSSDLDSVFSYQNTQGIHAQKRLSSLVLHFFNHQTHHRGQVSVLLSQSGQDIGITDLLALISEEAYED
ncbi:DinB family protein [Marinobacter sp. PE14]